MENIQRKITEFLAKSIQVSPTDLDAKTEIYSAGNFSSLTVLELIGFIEANFSIDVGAEDLNQENFCDIGSLSRFVSSRLVAV